MLKALVLGVLLLVLLSGCAQNPTGKVVGTGAQTDSRAEASIETAPQWATYTGDTRKDTCASQTCFGKAQAGSKCVRSHWCSVNGDEDIAGNKPYCCTKL